MYTRVVTPLASVVLVSLTLAALPQCGWGKKSSRQPPANPTTATSTGTTILTEPPANWDGLSDYNGSAFEVIDE